MNFFSQKYSSCFKILALQQLFLLCCSISSNLLMARWGSSMRPLLSSSGSFQQRGRWKRLVAFFTMAPLKQERAGDQVLTCCTYVYIFVSTTWRQEVPCVVCRCERGHDDTFLFAPANSHVFISWWGILHTSAASLNLPEAYLT